MSAFPGPEPRQALGAVVPFDMELDAELWRWMPPAADLLVTRTPYVPGAVDLEFIEGLLDLDEIRAGVSSVVSRRADTAVYGCSSASFTRGRDGERRIREAMAAAGARDPVTSSGAIIEALDALGITRVAVATPYVPALAERFESFLAEHGLAVTAHRSLGRDGSIWEVPYAETAAMIREVDTPDAEAVLIGCTNLPTYDIIAPLEHELGKPILTANQTMVWAGLRRLGLRAVGEGQALLRR